MQNIEGLRNTDLCFDILAEIAVEFFQDAAPRELGRVDSFVASNVAKRACMSPCSLMLGMIYIERLKHRNPEYLQKIASSDLFLISMVRNILAMSLGYFINYGSGLRSGFIGRGGGSIWPYLILAVGILYMVRKISEMSLLWNSTN